jgi:hypothetical protein
MTNDSLNKASQVVFMLTCAALVTLAGIRVWEERSISARPPAIGAQENPLAPETRLAALDGISYDAATITVALVVQSQCQFCAASMGFYQQLAKHRAAKKLQFVAVSRESVTTTTEYLKQHGVEVDAVTMLKGSEIMTSGTPTLVLVRKGGLVDASWIGQLNPSQEREVLRRITSTLKRG